MESWEDYINSLDFELPEKGADKPILEIERPQEPEVVEEEKETKRVYVQKLVTEVWIYTDLEKKAQGNQTFQEVTILGEMDFDVFANIINKRKQRRRRK